MRHGWYYGARLPFQYPLADRRRCNTGHSHHADHFHHSFQYPLADRRRCNPVATPATPRNADRFSILLRIVGDVTIAQRRPTVVQERFSILLRIVGDVTRRDHTHDNARDMFQYPLADRRRCNEQGLCWNIHHKRRVSVSSCGS